MLLSGIAPEHPLQPPSNQGSYPRANVCSFGSQAKQTLEVTDEATSETISHLSSARLLILPLPWACQGLCLTLPSNTTQSALPHLDKLPVGPTGL